ncbi:hypothetical protein ES705_28751 [subsurface metagenome]
MLLPGNWALRFQPCAIWMDWGTLPPACSVHIDIPLVIRQLKEGKAHAALHTIKRSAAFPAILSRICPAPCESACRRGKYDSPVAICLLMGFTAAAVIIAAGKALQTGCSLVKAMAHGRAVAVSVHQYLRGEEVTGLRKGFHSHIGRLKDGEIPEFMKEAEDYPRVLPAAGDSHGFSKREAEREAGRCLHCDCRKKESCRLKGYAEEYGVHGRFLLITHMGK